MIVLVMPSSCNTMTHKYNGDFVFMLYLWRNDGVWSGYRESAQLLRGSLMLQSGLWTYGFQIEMIAYLKRRCYCFHL